LIGSHSPPWSPSPVLQYLLTGFSQNTWHACLRNHRGSTNNSHAIRKVDLLEQHLIKAGEVTSLRRQQRTNSKPEEQRTNAQRFFTGTGNPNALNIDSSWTSRSSADSRETGTQQERCPRRQSDTWRQLQSASMAVHEKSTGGIEGSTCCKAEREEHTNRIGTRQHQRHGGEAKKTDRHSA
jgi:hypothetical protein